MMGDAVLGTGLEEAMQNVAVAYYLIHSMRSAEAEFCIKDRVAAENFGRAARLAGVKRIIYLGGLGTDDPQLSPHLSSRHEVGDILRSSGIPVTEFRAAVIIGSGSLSFEMIRYLTERLPMMICPSWTRTRCQPIAIRDVLAYLVACLDEPHSEDHILEIGGADVLTYCEMMQQYAQVRCLRRSLISIPVLSPRLSSYWVNLITPIPASIARPLMLGLCNEVVVKSSLAHDLFPQIIPIPYIQAVRLALGRLDQGTVETMWSDALSAVPQGTPAAVRLTIQEGFMVERRVAKVAAQPSTIFFVVNSLGGKRGWLALNWAWRLRGWIDQLLGGVGMRRGRPEGRALRVGDGIDFWRVENVEIDRQLRLRAEMKLPGLAWLQFDIKPLAFGKTELIQTAFFAPKGLWGTLYGWLSYPIHRLIFSKMLRAIVHEAEKAKPKRI